MFVLLSQITGGLAVELAFPSAVGPRHCVQFSRSLADTIWENEQVIAIKQAHSCVHALRPFGVIEVSLIFEKNGMRLGSKKISIEMTFRQVVFVPLTLACPQLACPTGAKG